LYNEDPIANESPLSLWSPRVTSSTTYESPDLLFSRDKHRPAALWASFMETTNVALVSFVSGTSR
jgi:hypothetical protein